MGFFFCRYIWKFVGTCKPTSMSFVPTKYLKYQRSFRMRKFSKLARSACSHNIYSTIPNVLKWNWIDCMDVCRCNKYFETWKYICFWGARSLRLLAHLIYMYMKISLSVHLGDLPPPPPPHTKKLATLYCWFQSQYFVYMI